ncbi:unnamed protein product [Effrenium voratum]|uniref:Palmitoyltransferase n=1 Tax=Effrenium voratum TaxID=2562239 RepID=A0AA36I479_9DINO|nr:unnamed protein product [Effrenium voratum]
MEMEDGSSAPSRSQSSQPAPATASMEVVPQGDEEEGSSTGSMSTVWPIFGVGTSRDTFPARTVAATTPLNNLGCPPRVYEVWPDLGEDSRTRPDISWSKNEAVSKPRFCCCGRCVTGPDIDLWYNLCTWSFILIPSFLYFALCSQYLWEKVSPWLPIFTAAVLLATIAFLLLTSCTDPGILPRQRLRMRLPGLENEVARTLALPDDCVADGMMPPVLSDLRQTQGYRFCHTCEVIRPPRTSHCNDCGNCVLTFDHHCPFVNNCIGQRNYVFFSAFLISTGCLGVSVAVGVGIRCTHHDAAWKRSSPWIVGFLVLIGLATAVLLVGVVGLTIFHLFLLCTGKTTKEVCTGRMARHGRSLFARPPSLIHAREHAGGPGWRRP